MNAPLAQKYSSDQHQLKGIFFNQALQKFSQKALLIQDPDFTHSAQSFFVNHDWILCIKSNLH